jgi:hypothetical protein
VAIFKYAKVLILAPAVGSALIGIAGLAFGVVLIVGHHRSSHPALGQRSATLGITSQRSTDGELSQTHSQNNSQTVPIEKQAATAPAKPTEAHLSFTGAIDNNQFAFLNDYAGRAVDDADGKRKVKSLVGMVAPYTPYHFGADFPLPWVLNSLLLNDPQPIEIRDGRYTTMSGIRNAIHNRRGFLWIDTHKGIALGAIFFEPGNGEPSPTLTIFSRQLDRRSVRMSQLPRAFTEDLNRWAASAGVPPITTRYFIGASGEKTVLVHDENFCVRSAEIFAPSPQGVCEEMNAQAALIDMTATRFMEQTHNASNATMKTVAATGQVE